jgi:tetratricopeptide (TPR) repeat protein
MGSFARRWAPPIGVAVLTGVAFLPALEGTFVDFDDLYNFVLNVRYRGFGARQLAWMLGLEPTRHFWGPLTWLSHAFDWLVWGLNPWGFHLTNLVLHATTAGVFVLVAERLLRRAVPDTPPVGLTAGASAAALAWALHPLRVESVAWISERRDVLSGLLLVLTVLSWLPRGDAAAGARKRWTALALTLYALSMLAKPIGMTLPLVLLVLDVYPLRRVTLDRASLARAESRAALRELVPYAAVAVVGATLALALTHEVKGLADHPLWVRPLLLGFGLGFSLWKTVLPMGLIPLYEVPARWSFFDVGLLWATLAAAVITVAVVVLARRGWPAPAATWAVYLIVLLPVSGLVTHGGPQLAADRYTYVPAFALALLVGGLVCLAARAVKTGALAPGSARAAAFGLLVWLAGCGALTWQQNGVWRDSVTLWDHAVTFAPDCARCLHGLGVAWYRGGSPREAIPPLVRAVALRRDLGFQADLGLALWADGRAREAVPYLEQALTDQPRNGQLERRLAGALLDAGRPDDARARFATLVARRPDDVEALTGVGLSLVASGRPGESLPYLEKATALAPRSAHAHYALARAYLTLGDRPRADRTLAELRTLDPRLADRAEQR